METKLANALGLKRTYDPNAPANDYKFYYCDSAGSIVTYENKLAEWLDSAEGQRAVEKRLSELAKEIGLGYLYEIEHLWSGAAMICTMSDVGIGGGITVDEPLGDGRSRHEARCAALLWLDERKGK